MADTKITNLTLKSPPAGTEEIAVNDGGLDKKVLVSDLGSSLTNSNISPTTADVTAAVNTRYFADVSGLTANRNFVLPTPAVGDIIELNITVGDGSVIGTDYALIIIGDTGIKINKGSAATAWRKVWMTGDYVKLVADATDNWQVVEDGRVHPRGLSEASNATPTFDTDNEDFHRVTALAAAMTALTISGTPIEGQVLKLRIKDNATARALPFATDAEIEDGGGGLPTTTVISKWLTVVLQWNSTSSKWASVGMVEEP